MPIDDKTLLAGTKLLGGQLRGIDDKATLREEVEVEVKDSPQTGRKTQEDIRDGQRAIAKVLSDELPALADELPKGLRAIARALPSSAPMRDPTHLWVDLWHLLHYAWTVLRHLQQRQNATVADIVYLLDTLNNGITFPQGDRLDFYDPHGKPHSQPLQQIVGWTERRGDRPVTLQNLVRLRATSREFAQFEDLFRRADPRSQPDQLIKDRLASSEACVALEQKYWDESK